MRLTTLLTIVVWFMITAAAAIVFVIILIPSSITAQGIMDEMGEFIQYCMFFGKASQTFLRAAPLSILALMLAICTAGNVVLFALVRPVLHPRLHHASRTIASLSRASAWTLWLVAICMVIALIGLSDLQPGLLAQIAAANPLEYCDPLEPATMAQLLTNVVIVSVGAMIAVGACLLAVSGLVRRPSDSVLMSASPAPRVFDEGTS